MKTISPQELYRLNQENGVELIDVRTPFEFQEVHLDFARNVPLDQLEPDKLLSQRKAKPDEPIYLICKTGQRGQKACEKIRKAGFENVVNVEGGTTACVEAELPVSKGKKVMSLERQVRIAAGSLVVIGVVLGLALNPWFYGLAAFVGAGLVFAGVTDTCGMGMLIAKMPWNRVSNKTATG